LGGKKEEKDSVARPSIEERKMSHFLFLFPILGRRKKKRKRDDCRKRAGAKGRREKKGKKMGRSQLIPAFDCQVRAGRREKGGGGLGA